MVRNEVKKWVREMVRTQISCFVGKEGGYGRGKDRVNERCTEGREEGG